MHDMPIEVDNLYVIKNENGTVDSLAGPSDSVEAIIEAVGFIYGGTAEIVQVSALEDLDLCSAELRFDFAQSMN